ncbi:MAG: bifunctional UDP-N-acetylmuramoyl-tripeptide:D-alanyl-D-alanine ligase/alanine racemase [Flavobacteriales bacterium]|nr:bifunctional UDP-N-acetylmuramoyl-tripeptide:D-alanyl-D-alanine ligase/alanine racemase [Flavobacteriales bacterium]
MWTLKEIADICDGQIHGGDRSVEFFVTDSRRIHNPQRTIFVALKGERHDGHLFIENAKNSGVASFIIDDSKFIKGESSFILVKNSLDALQAIASRHRHTFNYPVIGITGSYGKTVVKDLLTRSLKSLYHIVKSPRSYNSQTGVPLSILDMGPEHDLGIFEAGISKPGEMAKLARIINPNIGIFTTIGQAHDEGFADRQEKILEKALLFENSEVLIFSRDNEDIHSNLTRLYGHTDKLIADWGYVNDSFLHIIEKTESRSTNSITYCTGGKIHSIEIPNGSEYDFENYMFLITTLHILGVDQKEIGELLDKSNQPAVHLEFTRTNYGKGLLVDIGPIDGPSIRTGIEQLKSLVEHQGITVILSGHEGSPVANDRRIREIAQACLDSQVVYIGARPKALSESIPNLRSFLSNEEFDESIHSILDPQKAILLVGEWSPSIIALLSRLQEKSHQTTVTINMTSLVHNLNVYRALIPEETKVMAMVKAFAYGSGEAEVAKLLQYHKVDYLTVAYPDEGVTLRNGGVDMPIMVMNSSIPEYEVLVENELEPELYSLLTLEAFIDHCEQNSLKGYPVHVKFDTGMHRLGIDPTDIDRVIQIIKNTESIKLVSVFSHLFSSDSADLSLSISQINRFEKLKASLEKEFDDVLFHILNSSGISRLPQATYDLVRLGIGLYGYSGDIEFRKNLLPVLSWNTVISQVKKVKAGETVGYGGAFVLKEDKMIAVIPVGYADGLSRKLGNGVGSVYIDGSKCSFIGNICMDMSMVDVTDISSLPGDKVELIGDNISLEEMAASMGTIPYEVLTSIPPRIKRHYIFNG